MSFAVAREPTLQVFCVALPFSVLLMKSIYFLQNLFYSIRNVYYFSAVIIKANEGTRALDEETFLFGEDRRAVGRVRYTSVPIIEV